MYFIYRSWNQGPQSKLVRHVPGVTVLDWFRRAWDQATGEWLEGELGTAPYGLHTIFETGEPAPPNMAELRRLMRTHLYYEEEFRVDDHSVRVLTNDDDVKIAYYFADDDLVAAEPDRWAYAVHDGRRLPDASDGHALPFASPVPPHLADLGETAHDGATYVIVHEIEDTDRSAGSLRPTVFPGVRLPHLASALRASDADAEHWPGQILALRALSAPGEQDITPALERRNRWPRLDHPLEEQRGLFAKLARPHPEAHATAMGLADAFTPEYGSDPELTLIDGGRHLAQMRMHTTGYFGYSQWFLFDDVWATAHPDLAASLLHYIGHWDPRCARRHPRYAPCADDAYLEIQLDDGSVVRDSEPCDEPELLRLIAELDDAGEHAEAGTLRDARTAEGVRVLVITDEHVGRDRLRPVLGAIAVELHSSGACHVRAFTIRPGKRRRGLGKSAALRLWHELRAAGIGTVTFERPRSRTGRTMARRLTQGRHLDGRVDVSLDRLRRSTNRWWMRSWD
ncbi:hypothetical protein OIE66_24150 [Nonomuraea sp. NBC_01738]|uniref:hypothetical protein n=1 Tax=Nonomuraea sp. NBC_01738 TaxID=2976003 RepID=UPI002E147507|nr:hypothetical protein OIE66_24150 [Nonomuraea sp. NBC_01738]